MGEVVVSSEEMKTESEKQRSTEMMKNNGGDSSSGVVMRWEKLLPGMNMRVLLVEADDSTRHIIAALLRKCSYRGEFGVLGSFDLYKVLIFCGIIELGLCFFGHVFFYGEFVGFIGKLNELDPSISFLFFSFLPFLG